MVLYAIDRYDQQQSHIKNAHRRRWQGKSSATTALRSKRSLVRSGLWERLQTASEAALPRRWKKYRNRACRFVVWRSADDLAHFPEYDRAIGCWPDPVAGLAHLEFCTRPLCRNLPVRTCAHDGNNCRRQRNGSEVGGKGAADGARGAPSGGGWRARIRLGCRSLTWARVLPHTECSRSPFAFSLIHHAAATCLSPPSALCSHPLFSTCSPLSPSSTMDTPPLDFVGPSADTSTNTVGWRTVRFPFLRAAVLTLGAVVRPFACCVRVQSGSGRSGSTEPTPPPSPPPAPEELVPAELVECLPPFVIPHGAVGDGSSKAAAQFAETIAPSALVEPDWHRTWKADTIVLGTTDGAVDAIARFRTTARRLPAASVAAAPLPGRGLPVVSVWKCPVCDWTSEAEAPVAHLVNHQAGDHRLEERLVSVCSPCQLFLPDIEATIEHTHVRHRDYLVSHSSSTGT